MRRNNFHITFSKFNSRTFRKLCFAIQKDEQRQQKIIMGYTIYV